jgi:hypothetical protein
MGYIEIFNLKLSDFHNALTLRCARDFSGNYFVGPEAFKVHLEHPERLAAAGQRLRRAGEIAVARGDGKMQPGVVWRHEVGGIEIGINQAGDAVYIQCGALRIEPRGEQPQELQAALGVLSRDLDLVSRASTPQTIQTSINTGVFDRELDELLQLPSWADDSRW